MLRSPNPHLLTGVAICALACTGTIDEAGRRSEMGGGSSAPGASQPGASGPGGPSAPVGAECKAIAVPPARLWRLTHAQLRNTIADTFGFTVPVLDTLPAESRLDGFANAAERLGLSSTLFQYYAQSAGDIAREVVQRGGFLGCAVDALGTGTCLTDFLATTGQKAWRRPLTPAEIARFGKLYTDAARAAGPEVGFEMVVQGLLLSPSFLFRTELGGEKVAPDGTTTLTDLELASALSYMLWDAPPDPTLMDLARAGKLRDPATLAAQARRLLSTTGRALPALASFVAQWLEAEDLTTRPKDTEVFPFFTPQLEKDMEEETRRFVQAVVFDAGGDRSLRTLLTARHGYLNPALSKLYGQPAAGGDFVKTELDPTQRRGLLTQAGFLASHAEPAVTSVVNRGRFLREEVLCSDVPPPPGDFRFDEKVITEDMTAREKLTVHSTNPSCAACHKLFDGIGFALENYDALGQWRTTEKGKPIDPSGTLALPSGAELRFSNFIDLIDQLAEAPDAYDCFSAQFLTYATGRVKLDDCERAAIAKAFADSGYRLDALVLAVVGSPSFMIRKN